MRIHTVKSGESVSSIAKLYGIKSEHIKSINELPLDEVTVGDELLILIPTRTYEAGAFDSLSGLSHRFSVEESELIRSNPGVVGGELGERTIFLKYPPRPYGMAAANGYMYKGLAKERLIASLPYLTYLTLAAASYDKRGITKLFDTKEALRLAREERVIPLLRIYFPSSVTAVEKETRERLIDEMIELAKKDGFDGITLDFCDFSENERETLEFIVMLRGRMIGSDLILFSEIDESTPYSIAEYSDGCIFRSSRADGGMALPAEDRPLLKFARESESIKTLIELPSFGYAQTRAIPLSDAIRLARESLSPITEHRESLTSSFKHKRQGEIIIPHLKNTKAILDLVKEHGYMGICIDIMRSPLSILQMYNALYKSAKGARQISGGI